MIYDFIICGAGTAGCILANRLSADPSNKVLLLEAGGHPPSEQVEPIGLATELWDGPLDWAFRSTPQKHLNNRRILLNRGKALGGSSAINFCMYVRGNRGDYDHWSQLGNLGWGYDAVLPYFRRSEANSVLDTEYHGTDGPISVEHPKTAHPLYDPFFQALADLGIHANADYNGANQEGSFTYQFTTKDGKRCSAADGYLTPVMNRENLTVVTGAHITGLSIEGRRVTGVHYARGQEAVHVTGGETILSMGAIGSPHLLMLSGIGPAAEIAEHGIDVLHDLVGVGKNLLDHFSAPSVGMTLREPGKYGFPIPSLKDSQREFNESQTGPLATLGVNVGAFIKLRQTDAEPSVQLVADVSTAHRERDFAPRMRFFGYVCRSVSQGEITLASANPFDRPLINPNYLDDPEDLNRYVEFLQFLYNIVDHRAFDTVRGEILGPGRDTKSIEAAVRAEASTTWHQTSTCRMGVDDRAVVDPSLKVHGLDGIRVVDASIFPTMTSGNTNAPTMMVAEKGADLILGNTAPVEIA